MWSGGQEGTGQLRKNKQIVDHHRDSSTFLLPEDPGERRQPFRYPGIPSHQINSFPRQLIDLTSLRRGYVALHGTRYPRKRKIAIVRSETFSIGRRPG